MPRLYLIPNSINDSGVIYFPENISCEIKRLRLFFVEEPKSARRLLKSLDPAFPLADCRFLGLNEHSKPMETRAYVQMLINEDGAVISEAGCPCVADPGADLVLLAHLYHIEIVPLVGPSSILLAVMASGLSGQHFAFNGYISRERSERIQRIKFLEERSYKEKQTQIFMEAPYRNQNLLEDVLSTCADNTCLCLAYALTSPSQMIKTMRIREWKKNPFSFDKKPALFLLQKI